MMDIKSSPHYDKIVEFLYEDNDLISKLIISHYQDYLANIKSKQSKLNIDHIMDVYTEKEEFYKYVQNYFDLEVNQDLLDSYDKVMLRIIKLYKLFEEERIKAINSARWI